MSILQASTCKVFTGKSINSKTLWKVIKNIITEMHIKKSEVEVITSDMGGANFGIWRVAGIDKNKDFTKCYIPNPCDNKKHL